MKFDIRMAFTLGSMFGWFVAYAWPAVEGWFDNPANRCWFKGHQWEAGGWVPPLSEDRTSVWHRGSFRYVYSWKHPRWFGPRLGYGPGLAKIAECLRCGWTVSET